MMSESGKTKLHSVLFDGCKELRNVKFFPGTGRGLTSDELGGAAADALNCAIDAWRAGEPSCPPVTGMPKRQLMG